MRTSTGVLAAIAAALFAASPVAAQPMTARRTHSAGRARRLHPVGDSLRLFYHEGQTLTQPRVVSLLIPREWLGAPPLDVLTLVFKRPLVQVAPGIGVDAILGFGFANDDLSTVHLDVLGNAAIFTLSTILCCALACIVRRGGRFAFSRPRR